MFVKPKEGLLIFDPFKKDRLPPEGREVNSDFPYWERLLRDEDVTSPVQDKPITGEVKQ